MIIHFIASKNNFDEDYSHFKDIVDTVKNLGHEVARDWITTNKEFTTNNGNYRALNWKELNKINMAALSRADVVIAEVTTSSFSIGYLTSLALQQKKPVLMLSRNDAINGNFISGLESDLLQFSDYSQGDLREIISNFIKDNTIENKDLRFNFFIDRQIYNYLRWAAFKTGKTKAEVLRQLVLREINKDV